MSVAVLIPVLGRPARVRPIVESLAACSRAIECRPVFIVSPGDEPELRAINRVRADHVLASWPPSRGDYARKINLGFRQTDDPFVFLAGDDLSFQPGWVELAVAAHYETGACVIGTNDLGNRRVTTGRHSTHTLVCREYGECGTIDDPSLLVHEGYWHNFVDDEFVQTAIQRETFHAATDAVVEHLHPSWGKGHEDATYRLGQQHFNEDRTLYNRRKGLWRKRGR